MRCTWVRSRKSQSALEYLLTYGWAILVVVLVIVALYSLGLFNAVPSTPSISGFYGITVSSAQANSSVLEFSINNNLGISANITNITVYIGGSTYKTWECTETALFPGEDAACAVLGSFSTTHISPLVSLEYSVSSNLGGVSNGTIALTPNTQFISNPFTAYSVDLSVYNNQTSATPSPFQQMITFDPQKFSAYELSNLGNIRFYYGAQELYSWCESGCSNMANKSVFWIKLTSSIPANTTIYPIMVFEPLTNYDANYAGEAPQLSPTYAEYDDGANVFNYYENFAGSGLPSGWQELTSSGDTYTWDNGISFTNNGHGDYISIGTTSAVSPAGILELGITSGSNARPTIELATTDTQVEGGQPIYMYEDGYGQSYGMYSGDMQFEILTTSFSDIANSKTAYNAPIIEGIAWTATGSQLLEIVPNYNYNNMETVSESSTSNSLSTPLYIMLGQAASGSSSNTGGYTANWLRTRAYPPNGVMPSVKVGNVGNQPLYERPITFYNAQSVSTANPYQQMLTINSTEYSKYEAPNLDNIKFFYLNGSVVPSWLESGDSYKSNNTVYWLKLVGIPPDGYITIYEVFYPLSDNVLNTVNTGEAPQLSPTYAEYDDGADVFLNYYSGASDNGWTLAGTSGQTSSAPSGSPFGTNALYALDSGESYMYTTAAGQSTNMIIEYYTYINRLNDVFFLENSNGAGQLARQGDGSGWYGIASTSSWTSWNAPPDTGSWSGEWVLSGVVVADGTATQYLSTTLGNYRSEIGQNPSNTYTVSNNGNYLGLVGDGGGSADEYWNGLIIRAYPPNGVMPSVSFGSVQ